MATFKITAYHGSDLSVAEDIVRDEFHCNSNKEHWLGDGIYFYIDKNLAEWWTTKPTNKHGMEIKEPVIIECAIEAEEDKVLNLCDLQGYKKYVDLYNSFFKTWAFQAKPQEEVNIKQLRCAFFNFLLLIYDIDMIIAPFILPDQPYMPRYFNDQYANNMHISYCEVQICVAENHQHIIKNKVVHELKGDDHKNE